MTGWQTALHRIALGLAFALGLGLVGAKPSAAQQGGAPDAGGGVCTPNSGAHECPDRCARYDTCITEEGLYYRVNDQRFDCEGYDCVGASETLGDYCCRRGEFAPSRGGGGGCTLSGAPPSGSSEAALGGALLAAFALALAGRRGPRRARCNARRA